MAFVVRAVRGSFLLLVALWVVATPARGGSDSPAGVVDAFHSDLLSVMKDAKNLGISGRYKKILSQVDRYFHMPLMVRFVTGNHWATASPDEQMALLKAARDFSAGEMAVLFGGYSGETFKTVRTQAIEDGSVLVETELVRPADDNVTVIYRTRKFSESWRIIDVILDGSISQLLKRRGEYRRTLSQSGIPGLTALLRAKADEIVANRDK